MRTRPTRTDHPPSVKRTGYLGLGSNVGDRESHLRAAIDGLRERGVEVEAVSSTYETEPVGEVLDQSDFLNAAIRVRTELEPEALLDLCKEIEVERGRALDAPRHSPRPLDVDLLLLGELELETERLVLPHREVTTRRFVLVPLLELDPRLALPDGTSLAEALAALGPGQRAEKTGSLKGFMGSGPYNPSTSH
jgi:2-amino-4-hydroxy-6-hydroxymethyldihydropteridine diphosphokinase